MKGRERGFLVVEEERRGNGGGVAASRRERAERRLPRARGGCGGDGAWDSPRRGQPPCAAGQAPASRGPRAPPDPAPEALALSRRESPVTRPPPP